MKSITLSLLVAALSLCLTAPTSAHADEPGGKEQPRKTVKARKKAGRKPMFSRRKESDYQRAIRRNELLREPEAPQKQ